MDCSCDMEYPSVYSEEWRIARKPHECCECGSPIDPGEKYMIHKGLWEGKWSTFKQCELCAKMWDSKRFEYSDCMSFGEMWDFLGS